MYDLDTLRERRAISITVPFPGVLCFSPDGRLLAVTGSGFGGPRQPRAVEVYDTATGEQHVRLVGHHGDIAAMAFSPDGRTLATGSRDKLIKLWNVPPLDK